VEVLWHGIPTIAWDVSSNAEVIEDGVSGWLVKLGDVEGMKNKILVQSTFGHISSGSLNAIKLRFDQEILTSVFTKTL